MMSVMCVLSSLYADWLEFDLWLEHGEEGMCKQPCIYLTYIHTYMNRSITAPELESKKLKCVQVHERVQMDTGLTVAS